MGGGGGEAAGACENESDLGVIDSAEDTLRNIARDCGTFQCGNRVGMGDAYESCVNMCIEERLQDLSPECIACYGAGERCSHDSFCRMLCQNASCGLACLNCMNGADCIEELEECTGIPDDTCE